MTFSFFFHQFTILQILAFFLSRNWHFFCRIVQSKVATNVHKMMPCCNQRRYFSPQKADIFLQLEEKTILPKKNGKILQIIFLRWRILFCYVSWIREKLTLFLVKCPKLVAMFWAGHISVKFDRNIWYVCVSVLGEKLTERKI